MFRRDSVITIVIIVVLIMGAALYTGSTTQRKSQKQFLESPAGSSLQNSDIHTPYTSLNGEVVSITDYAGSVLVVTTWASWCPSCVIELKKLSSIAGEISGRPVHIIAINRGESQTTAERFLNTIDTIDGIEFVLDRDDRYFQSIGGYAMPETVIYNEQGQISFHGRGEVAIDVLKRELKLTP